MILKSLSPTSLVLIAVFSIQLGAGLATTLFAVLGAQGTVALRLCFSALLLLVLVRRKPRELAVVLRESWVLLLGFGVCIAVMNLFFYMAIARIPLGAAVAIEFLGPLGVAALKSRRLIHFAWVALAAIGVFLLSPFSGVNLELSGVLFAALAGLGWALFIVFAESVGKRTDTNDGLVIGMVVAAMLLSPFAIPVVSELVMNPVLLLSAFGVALLSTTIPFSFEFEALKRMPVRNYGILVSSEPAVATTVGVVFLGERLGLQGIVAVVCVVIAAVGISLSD